MPPTHCFSSLGCPERNATELCRTARLFGCSCIELRSLEGKGDYATWLATHPESVTAFRLALRNHAIRVAVLGASFDLTINAASDIDALVEIGRVADVLEAPYVRIFGGGGEGGAMPPELIRRAAQLYVQTLGRCADAGVASRLIVETHGGLVDSATVQALCNEAGQAVPMLWDTHHTWKLGGESPAFTWSRIKAHVRHLHVKDSRSAAGTHGYQYVLPGQGEYPFAELFQAIKREPTEALLSLEWERQWHPELAPIEDALTAWVEVLKNQGMGELTK